MKRSIILLTIVALAGLSLATGHAKDGTKAPILKDNRVDTALLGKPINPKMDVSKLPLYLVRIYRQIPAAQRGFWLMQQDLNSVFSQTDWYQERAMEAAEKNGGILPPLT